LSFELETESNINFVHFDFNVSIGIDERGDMVMEVVASEFGSQLGAVKSDGVVGSVSV
jgi:hypothetical protein